MTDEEQKQLDSLIVLLGGYRDDMAFIDDFSSRAEAALGADWRTALPSLLGARNTPDAVQAAEKFNRLQEYENAVLAWNEANELLNSPDVELSYLKERLPSLEYWLAFFGDAGTALVNKLKDFLPADELADFNTISFVPEAEAVSSSQSSSSGGSDESSSAPSPARASVGDNDIPADILWNFEYFMRLKDYYDRTIERTGARCVKLGGIEMSQYKHYGYILDVMSEIVELGKQIENDKAYARLIDERFPKGRDGFEDVITDFIRDLEANATPEMLDKDLNSDEIKAQLGGLATDEDDGDIGPAPDGFEPIPDLGDYEPATDITTTAETIRKQRMEKENAVSGVSDVVNK